MPGRLITDNSLIAYESLHTIRHQRAKQPFFALKIDMTKAYDRVEWSFLHGCLSRLGFNPAWINSVMRCVTNVRYAVRVNGELTAPVVPSRGIRQGDPISPYLFLLCTEGLSSLLLQKESCGELHGIRNGRSGPPISHLLFADDSIFFARSDACSVVALKTTLNPDCSGSCQLINKDKSSLLFGHGCSETVKQRVKASLGISNEAFNDTYLGMPTEVGKSPTSIFKFLPDRAWRCVHGWSDRPVSRAGKETLLKSIIQAIPTFIMSCFELPKAICRMFRQIIADEWWGGEDGKKKIHWRSWDWLSTPKSFGGMGFRDMHIFNLAMLGKQGWRLLTVPDSLCARVLKGRYFPHTDFWNAPAPRSASATWHSILAGRDLLKKGVQWGIGDGCQVHIISDHWIPSSPPCVLQPLSPIPVNAKVKCLMDEESGSWNEATVRAFFRNDVACEILRIPIYKHGEDFVRWPFTRFGEYTVRSAYNLARSALFLESHSNKGMGLSSNFSSQEKDWRLLWSIKAPGKMKVVLWRFARDCLPSGEQLKRRQVPNSEHCCFCARSESVEHALLFCPHARDVWDIIKEEYNFSLHRGTFLSQGNGFLTSWQGRLIRCVLSWL